MNHKINSYLKNNDFDIYEPHAGHEERFLRKLQQPKKKTYSWKWMSIAASVLLLLGFYLGSFHQQKQYDLKDVSPKMAEAQSFFTTAIKQDLNEVERYRTIDTEVFIEDALDNIEELEDQYKSLKNDLNTYENQRFKIQAMINNYQKRLDILKQLLKKLDELEHSQKLNTQKNEII